MFVCFLLNITFYNYDENENGVAFIYVHDGWVFFVVSDVVMIVCCMSGRVFESAYVDI